MRKRYPVVLAVALLVGAALSSTAMAGHSWGSYHWARSANPVQLAVGDNVSGSWDASLDKAIADWDNPIGGFTDTLALTKVSGGSKGKCRPTAGRIEVCADRYGFNGWLGLAQIWASGNHITQAVAKMNDTYLASGSYDATARQHVMCQEVGHDFGLGHQDESGADLNTCMDYADALDNPSPNAHDYQQLETIYAHTDSGSAASPGAAASDAAPERVERSDRIVSSTITEHFHDGSRRITEIFWALEGPGNSGG